MPEDKIYEENSMVDAMYFIESGVINLKKKTKN